MKKSLLIIAALLFMGVYAVFAQGRTVRGTVLDENGEPLIGASINVKGGPGAAQSQADGTFEINVPDGFSQIEVVYAGYALRTVKITEDMSITLTQEVRAIGGDAVITTPYGGEIARAKFTGSGDRIGTKEISRMPLTNAARAIEGRSPGVMITGGGGPGSQPAIRVRGFGSLNAGAEPLIVVDGNPFPGSISSINPNDIESMDVLKDATATSLYGSRGANGVIMITTKSGRGLSRNTITIDAKVGMTSRSIPNYDLVKNSGDYYEFAWDAVRNQFRTGGFSDEDSRLGASIELVERLGGYNSFRNTVGDYDLVGADGKLNPNATSPMYQEYWDDELMGRGFRQDYNISAAGGNSVSDYYFSAGYLNEKSYLKFVDYDRFSFRSTVNSKVSQYVKFGLNVTASMENSTGPASTTYTGTAPGYNPFMVSRSFAPIYPVYYYDQDGNKEIDPITGNYKYDWGNASSNLDAVANSSIGDRQSPNANVLGALDLDRNKSAGYMIGAIPSLEAKFLKDFTFRTALSATYRNFYSDGYRNRHYGQFAGQDTVGQGGIASRTNTSYLVYSWNQVLSWRKSLEGGHNFDALAGHENYDFAYNQFSASRNRLAVDGNKELYIGALPLSSSSLGIDSRMESYFAQFSYNYKAKYFFTANFRRDGSSNFHPDTRWGNFWSIGGSWMLDQEKFMEDIDWVNMLKFKASYGTQGQRGDILDWAYAYMSLFDISFNDGVPAYSHIQLPNNKLKWENQKTTNIGLDFELFDRRVRGEIAYFRRVGDEMLYLRPLPPSTGYNGRYENVASVSNSGIEVRFDVDVVKQKDLIWNVDLNFSHIRNKILSLTGDDNDTLITGNFMWKKGYSIYEYYLVHSSGVDTATGKELYRYYDSLGNAKDTTSYTHALGNGGREFRGSGIPWLMGGITNNIDYKGFDLSFMFTFGLGGYYYDGVYQQLMGNLYNYGNNIHQDWLTDRWTEENRTGTLPKVEANNADLASNSDRWLINRSYLNFRNVNLGYTFKNEKLKDLGLQNLRVYVACDNVFLLTKRRGMDPQANFSGSTTYTFNPTRTFMFGVNVGL